MTMRIGAKVPTSGPLPAELGIGAMAASLELAGFDGLWVSDHVVMPERISSPYPFAPDRKATWPTDVPWYDAVVAMAMMAATTSRAHLNVAVLVLPLRHPVELAKQVASIDVLSGGRVGLGVGAGWLREEFDLVGQEFGHRGARMDEQIGVLRALWTGQTAFRGRFYDFDTVSMLPAPPAPVPILVGGESPSALRRAAQLGDGFVSVAHRAATLLGLARRLDELRQECGRRSEPFELNVLCTDARDADDYRALEAGGVTSALVRPWGDEHLGGPVLAKERLMETFADATISAFR